MRNLQSKTGQVQFQFSKHVAVIGSWTVPSKRRGRLGANRTRWAVSCVTEDVTIMASVSKSRHIPDEREPMIDIHCYETDIDCLKRWKSKVIGHGTVILLPFLRAEHLSPKLSPNTQNPQHRAARGIPAYIKNFPYHHVMQIFPNSMRKPLTLFIQCIDSQEQQGYKISAMPPSSDWHITLYNDAAECIYDQRI